MDVGGQGNLQTRKNLTIEDAQYDLFADDQT